MKDYDRAVLRVGDVVEWDKEVGVLPADVPSWVAGCSGLVVKRGRMRGDFVVRFVSGDEVFESSFAQNWFLEPVRVKVLASVRAGRAAERASRWHQGSGIHADGLCAACQHFEELGHPEVAGLFAAAAEAEAVHLEGTGGVWLEVGEWEKSPSGVASRRAEEAARKVEPGFDLSMW